MLCMLSCSLVGFYKPDPQEEEVYFFFFKFCLWEVEGVETVQKGNSNMTVQVSLLTWKLSAG